MEHFREKLLKISEDYFNYMAKHYPVICSSDEFYFFPRANKVLSYLNCLDSLDAHKIKHDVSYVTKLSNKLEKLKSIDLDLETQIDIRFLKQSMGSFLREFEQVKVWRKDPNIYLKICLLGIDQIIIKRQFIGPNYKDALLSRIKKIPTLLDEAKINLTEISQTCKQTSIELSEVAIDYFKKNLQEFLNTALIKKIILSLEEFVNFLKVSSPQKEFLGDRDLLEDVLKKSFSYGRSPDEIFQIAQEEYQNTLEEMIKTARKIDSQKKWQQILSEYKLNIKTPKELLKLYSGQINKLKDFLIRKDLIAVPRAQGISVEATPSYLMPIRASASYNCPLTRNPKEKGIFYVTVYFDKDKELAKAYFDNVHQEYIFVSAHETFPGHHLLDLKRKGLKNPIRQQIESVLFYEGWASYVERLIDRIGYVDNPIQRLIGLRRQAWRAIRAMLDVGIRINKLKLEDAGERLKDLGYSSSVVNQMLKHYQLTYGYQLCYTMGKFEIERLRKKFTPKFGLKGFHNFLLDSGQIPFDLLEKRLERLDGK